MTIPRNTIVTNAITANLAALSHRLARAAHLAEEAHAAITEGQQNQAIGTIMDLELLLAEAKALFEAALALHRGRVE